METAGEYENVKHRILEIPFVTVSDYLGGLEALARLTGHHCTTPRVIFYLPAAVSDFYLPEETLAEHKIQSRELSKLTVELLPVPKKLGVIKELNPRAFVASYKLETDEAILA